MWTWYFNDRYKINTFKTCSDRTLLHDITKTGYYGVPVNFTDIGVN